MLACGTAHVELVVQIWQTWLEDATESDFKKQQAERKHLDTGPHKKVKVSYPCPFPCEAVLRCIVSHSGLSLPESCPESCSLKALKALLLPQCTHLSADSQGVQVYTPVVTCACRSTKTSSQWARTDAGSCVQVVHKHGDHEHTHDERMETEQKAVDLEADDAERSRLTTALVKVPPRLSACAGCSEMAGQSPAYQPVHQSGPCAAAQSSASQQFQPACS